MAVLRNIVIFCVLAGAYAHEGYPRNYPERQLNYDQGYNYQSGWDAQENEWTGKEIPGVAGRDYPTYSEVPATRFDCERQQYPGYYADTETNCQAFHICQQGGRKDSFLCPNGTLFNQEKLVCEWWNSVDCSRAESFYSVNEAVARAMEEATRRSAERQNNGRYQQYGLPKYQNGLDDVNRQAEKKFPGSNIHQSQSSGFHGNIHRESANLPTSRPVYGVPDLTAPALPLSSGHYDSGYNQNDKYSFTGASFGKQQNKQEPNNIYLPA